MPVSLLKRMATGNGLEPSTSSVTGWHSNQLNYPAACRRTFTVSLAIVFSRLRLLSYHSDVCLSTTNFDFPGFFSKNLLGPGSQLLKERAKFVVLVIICADFQGDYVSIHYIFDFENPLIAKILN